MAVDRRFLVGVAKDWGIALILAVAVFVGWQLFRGGPEVGGEAPDFTLSTLDGETFTLSDLRGETVVLNFWATWCGPCKQEIPALSAFQRDNPEVRLVGVNVDENMGAGAIRRISERLGVAYTVVLDPFAAASGKYRIDTLPTTVIIAPDGHVASTRIGTVDQYTLEDMVAAAMAHEDG